MSLAYQGETNVDLRPRAGKEARRRHIFDHYIAKNFARRPLPAESPYSERQARAWLTNLAQGMGAHGQSVFYIEKLQPSWLGDGRGRRAYPLLVGLVFGLVFGLFLALFSGLTSSKIEPGEILRWRWPGGRRAPLGKALSRGHCGR
jgi:eukaryotic-like serine/threonine-protein kinase